jgi:hypothetical protein
MIDKKIVSIYVHDFGWINTKSIEPMSYDRIFMMSTNYSDQEFACVKNDEIVMTINSDYVIVVNYETGDL